MTNPRPLQELDRPVDVDAQLTAATVGEALEHAEMRLLAQTDDVVIAERAVLGMPHVLRRVLASDQWDGTWKVAHLVRRGSEHSLTHTHVVRDALELMLWLGGVMSVPVDRAEVDALCHLTLV